MSRLRLAPVLLTVVTAGALALAGCSSSGGTAAGGNTSSSGGGSSSTAPAGSTSNSAGSGASALVPAAIKSKGTLTIAMDATYAPDESIAVGGSTIVGFDADLAKAVATDLGMQAKLVNATFSTIIPSLQSGKFDVGFSSFTDTKAREAVVDFVTYFQAGEGFYVKAGSSKTFNGLASLCGAKVAVETGTTEQTDAETQSKTCTTAGKAAVNVLKFADQNAANLAVSSGRAEVGFVDSQIAGYIVKQSNGVFQTSGTAFGVAPYGIALPKGNRMAAAVLQAIKDLIANGTYNTILSKWGVQAGAITTPVINGATS